MTAAGHVKVEAARQVRQQLYSPDHTGGATVVSSGDKEAVAPQISYCLATEGHTPSDRNKGE